MPFASDTVDLVVSNVAIHNIKTKAERARAIDEAVRVLKPGGRLAIADLFATGDYVNRLRDLGITDVTRRNSAAACGGEDRGCRRNSSRERNDRDAVGPSM